jgi:uncharacterized protein YqgV (UPF0045/DUF77 family)
MRITVELSLYPFNENFRDPIKDFIERLKSHQNLDIVINPTSTLVTGEHFYLFDVLAKESAKTFEKGKNVLVMKVLGFERDVHRVY